MNEDQKLMDVGRKKQRILEELEPLFVEAAETGKVFLCHYQAITFTPKELREAHKRGEFIWGPQNWSLVDPQEIIRDAERAADAAVQVLKNTKRRFGS